MNANRLLTFRPFRVFPMSGLSLCVAMSSAALAQAPVRDDPAVPRTRDVPVARDVRVVDPVRPLKRGDREFLEKAAKTSMSEVAISRVAAARTSNPDVRRFAQMIVTDHDGVMEQLSSLARARGVSLPAKDPHPDKWEKRDAKNFDKAYLEQMVDDHESVVKLFEKHAKEGEDADVVAFARQHLPKLQQHLQHAIDLKRVLTDKRERR
jgi:predicted outer membrane protein